LRFVFDTNVLVSALLLPNSKPRHALDRAFESGTILISLAGLGELVEVLGRKRLRDYIDDDDARQFIAALTINGELVEVDTTITVCRDPKDNKFLELAICGAATYIVTGDSDLLDLNPFRGVAILTPSAFLEDPRIS
jgi:putative PIN family toxin of toxin-antitoxin system